MHHAHRHMFHDDAERAYAITCADPVLLVQIRDHEMIMQEHGFVRVMG